MMFTLPPLPFALDGLEPRMSERTLKVHYKQLHAGYVRRLNDIVAADPELSGAGLLELLELAPPGSPLAHNAGGHYNHSFFWTVLSPPYKGGSPLPETLALIEAGFGDLPTFIRAFSEAAASLWGSAWLWAVLDPDGVLRLVALPDQETPIAHGYVPLLGLDLWEHAYLFDFDSYKHQYIASWWALVNWQGVERNFLTQAFY